jgi:type VI secretion system VasD/TssJ family lipoprotein
VLELRDASSFESLSFEDAWTPAPAIEGAIVSTRSVTLYPGETSELDVQPSPETHALVGIAIVRRPAGRTWRVIVPVESLPCGSSASLAWLVDEYRIERASEER